MSIIKDRLDLIEEYKKEIKRLVCSRINFDEEYFDADDLDLELQGGEVVLVIDQRESFILYSTAREVINKHRAALIDLGIHAVQVIAPDEIVGV
jgi:hypothetical protein